MIDLAPACCSRSGTRRITSTRYAVEQLEPRIVLAVIPVVGLIADGTHWQDGNIYRITGDASVAFGSTLTIEPGAIVQFDVGVGADLDIAGTLLAAGTSAKKIIFTSVRDDSGPDGLLGNGDDFSDLGADGSTAGSAGDWGRIYFAPGSSIGSLDYWDVRYGGAGWNNTLEAAQGFTLAHSRIANSSAVGLRLESVTATLNSVSFTNNSGSAILMDAASDPTFTGTPAFTNNAWNGVDVSGSSLPADITWSDPVVYRLLESMNVPAGRTLTLGAGQIIKAAGGLTIQGTLIANGTSGAPVIFTNILDDSAGGDSNNGGPAQGPDGASHGLSFTSTTTGSVLSHVEMRYFDASRGAIEMDGVPSGAVTIQDSLIRNSADAGIYLLGSNPIISRVTFQNNADAAIRADPLADPVITAPVFSSNAINGYLIQPGTFGTNTTWNDPDIVYVLGSQLVIPAGRTLTVAAGQIVKSGGSDTLSILGTINVNGTAKAPVIFTSLRDDSAGGDTNNNASANAPAPGDWPALNFLAGSTTAIGHAEFRYGGANAFGENGALNLSDVAAFAMSDSVIRQSMGGGMRMDGSNPTLARNSFVNNVRSALSADLNSHPVITDPEPMTGNGVNALALDNGTLPAGATTWNQVSVPYFLRGEVIVPVNGTLTIAPGQVIKAIDGGQLTVRGVLNAVGTAAQPIVFTSDSDDSLFGRTNAAPGNPVFAEPGEWIGLRFASTVPGNAPGTSLLDHVEVRYAGGASITSGAVTIAGGSLTLQNSVLRDSRNLHVRIESSTPFITGNTFSGATGAALGMDLDSNPDFGPNTFLNNDINGMQLDSGNLMPGGVNWDDPEIVYEIRQMIVVPAGMTLNIAPGMVIKADSLPVSGTFNPIFVAGKLSALGTVDQPIIFTSWHDRTVGGETASRAPGFWGGLRFSNASTGSVLDHIDIRFTYSAAIALDGSSSLTLRDSAIPDVANGSGVVLNNNSTVTLTNTVISSRSSFTNYGIAAADSTLIATNNTIHGFQYGVSLTSNTTQTLKNNLITGSRYTGVQFSGPLSASFNDVFSAPGGSNWSGDFNPDGTNGNRSFDPQYVNAASLQLRLRSVSAAIDAGTSTGAPTLDSVGAPRFDNPGRANTGGGAMPYVDLGAFESLAGTSTNVDLTVTTVSSTKLAGLPGELATISWTVRNIGTGPTQVPWKDAIYLSHDAVFSPDDVLLGEALHGAVLGAGLSYSTSASVALPSVLPDDYHFIVRANASGDVLEGANLTNNPGASAGVIAMDLPALPLGTAAPGSILQTGGTKLFKVTAPGGDDLLISLDAPAGFANEMYIRYGDLPTRQIFDLRGVAQGPDQNLNLTNAKAGVYYVMVYGADVPGLEAFTVEASLAAFKITEVGPTTASNAGLVTFTIDGAKFEPGSQPQLVDSAGATILPLKVYFTDSGEISATFDLRGHPTGPADVRIVNPGNVTTTAADAVEIVNGPEGRLVTNLIAPAEARFGRRFQLVIEYFNAGGTDLLAPALRVEGGNLTQLSLDPDFLEVGSSFSLLGTSSDGPAGILAPGEKGRIIVYGKANTAGVEHFNLYEATYPNTPIDWTILGGILKPDGMTTAEWNPIAARLQANIGNTWANYRQALSNDATLLPSKTGLNYSLEDVLQVEVRKAIADLQTSASGKLFLGDTDHPLRNVEVQLFDRTTGDGLFAASSNDGSFLIPKIAAGSYEVTVRGHVLPAGTVLTVGAGDANNLQYIAQPGAVIAGQVVRTAVGAPLRDVVVTALSNHGDVFTATTGLDGSYFFEGLPAGTYEITGGGGAFTRARLSDVVVGAAQQKLHADLALEAGATLRGVVTGPSGVLAHASVVAFDANGLGASATTDATGAFTIVGLSGQSYSVSASADGFATITTAGVVVPGGGTKTGVNFTLSGSGSIAGTVTPLAGGALATPVEITFDGPGGTFTTATLADGSYSIAGLTPGHYTIATSSDLFMTRTAAADVTTGAQVSLPLTVAARGQVSGTITAQGSGLPVQKVIVFAQDANGYISATVTDSLGHYTLSGFDAGSVEILLGDEYSPGLTHASVTLGPGNVSATANLSVPVAGIVSGTVFGANGLPAENAIVGLTQSGVSLVSMSTDEDGHYAFVVVANGTYQLEALGEELVFPVISGLVLDGNDTLTALDFHPGAKGITGTVRDGNGMPVAGALVSIDRADPGLAFTLVTVLVTGPDGTFNYTGAVPGNYTLTAQADGFAYDLESVIVTNGAAPNVLLDLGAEGKLHGVVHGANAPLLAGAQIILSRPGFDFSFVRTSDASGAFDFTGLAPGTYQATVVAPNHQTLLVTNVTVGTGDQARDFTLAASTIEVHGVITNGTHPLGKVFVTATDANGAVFAETVTTRDGHYSLGTLPAGQYTLTASGTGYFAASLPPITVANGMVLGVADLALTPAGMSDIQLDSEATTVSDNLDNFKLSAAALMKLKPGKGYFLEAGDQELLFTKQKDPRCEEIRIALVKNSIELSAFFDTIEASRAELAASETELAGIKTIRTYLSAFNDTVKSVSTALDAFLYSNRVQKKVYNQLEINTKDVGEILANVRGWFSAFFATGPEAKYNYETALARLKSIMGPDGELAAVRQKFIFLDAAAKKLAGQSYSSVGLTPDQENLLFTIREAKPSKRDLQAKITTEDFLARLSTQNTLNSLGLLEADVNIAFNLTAKVSAYERTLDSYYRGLYRFVADFNSLKACEKGEEEKPNAPGAPGTPGGPGTGGPGGTGGTGSPTGGSPGNPGENKVDSADTKSGVPLDPNDKHGPTGYDTDPNTPGIQGNYIQLGAMPFEVEFENIGGIAAQLVVVTDQLHTNLDWSTFSFNSFGFSNRVYQVPAGRSHYEMTIDLRPDGIQLLVPVILDLNQQTGLVTVTFNSLDPQTLVPPDGFLGFLPVDNANGDGQGFFTYTVSPKVDLTTGAVITNTASIVFDTNAAILTPTTSHTIDVDAPMSSISALASTINQAKFDLSWSGNDATGSGLHGFDIYVSDNGGAYQLFLDDTTATSAQFIGRNGHTYTFYSVATDNVGLSEAAQLTADASTSVSLDVVSIDARHPLRFTDANGDKVTISLKGLGSVSASLERAPGSTAAANLDELILSNTDTHSNLSITVVKVKGGDGITPVNRLTTSTAKESIGMLTAPGVTFGSGSLDRVADLFIGGSASKLTLGNLAANTIMKIGGDYVSGVDSAAIALVKPALTVGDISGAGVQIGVTGGVKSFTAKSWAFDGDFTATGALGLVTVKGALKSDFAADTIGNVTVTLAKQSGTVIAMENVDLLARSIGNIMASVTGASSLATAFAISDSSFTATAGAIGKITATATSSKTDAALIAVKDTEFYAAGGIGQISATAKISARNATTTPEAIEGSTIQAGQLTTIQAVSDLVKTGITGLKAVGAVSNSRIAAYGSIGAVSVTGGMLDSLLLAGARSGADHDLLTSDDSYQRHGSIKSISVTGEFARTTIAAGIAPGTDFTWGMGASAAADALGAAISGMTAAGRIGAVSLGVASATTSTPFRTPGTATHQFAIEAADLTKVSIGRAAQSTFTVPVYLDKNGDGTEQATETLLREFPPV